MYKTQSYFILIKLSEFFKIYFIYIIYFVRYILLITKQTEVKLFETILNLATLINQMPTSYYKNTKSSFAKLFKT